MIIDEMAAEDLVIPPPPGLLAPGLALSLVSLISGLTLLWSAFRACGDGQRWQCQLMHGNGNSQNPCRHAHVSMLLTKRMRMGLLMQRLCVEFRIRFWQNVYARMSLVLDVVAAVVIGRML